MPQPLVFPDRAPASTSQGGLASLASAPIAPRPVLKDMAVVIPTLGRDILEASLGHIAQGTTWPAQLIVVDQGTGSAAARWIEHLQAAGLVALHLPSQQRGRSAGINRGLERVITRYVAVTDDDCLADALWLETMAARLRHHPNAIITGRVDPAGNMDVEFCVVPSPSPRVYERPQLKAQPLIGGNMGVAMAEASRIGPFDESAWLRSAEDSDWGYRALRLGIPIRYEPEVIVQHYNWRSADQRARRYREYSRSQGGFFGKHLRSGDGLVWLQAVRGLVRGPIRWLRGLIRRDQDMVERGRADTLELLPGIIDGLLRVRRS